MARLYANENFPFLAVAELRGLGHDVVTVAETGKANRATPDAEILEFAISTDRAVLYSRALLVGHDARRKCRKTGHSWWRQCPFTYARMYNTEPQALHCTPR